MSSFCTETLDGLGAACRVSASGLDASDGDIGIPPDAQKILDALGAHIAVFDRNGRIVAVNHSWTEFAERNGGRPERTGVGTNYLDVCRRVKGRDAEDARRSLAGLEALLDGSAPEFRLEYPCDSPTEKRWFLLHASSLRTIGGGAVTAHLTITERKLAEEALRRSATELTRSNEQLRRLADDLEKTAKSRDHAIREVEHAYRDLKAAQCQLVQAEKLSSLGQLVAGFAHEINNPLAFVSNDLSLLRRELLGLVELLTVYQQADEALAEHRPELLARLSELKHRMELDYVLRSLDGLMDRAGNGLTRIHQIVAALRSFARLDEAELKEVDLNEGIRSTIRLIRGKADDRRVSLHLESETLPAVECYPGQINQVVLNLLINAIDACPPGGNVIVRTAPCDAGVEIQVIDDGHGIEEDVRHRIFDPFFTTKPVGEGTGLGLSMSYGIVKSHGGRLEVESSPGLGSRFMVWLPRWSGRRGG
ncbi:MAG: ATP-binding protein [Isosphaeraceae bacterium]